MKCVKCGKKVKSGEKFCTYCGYYIGESEKKDDSWEIGADLLEEERINSEDEEEIELERDKFHNIELSSEEADKINPPELVEEKKPEIIKSEEVVENEFDDKELSEVERISVKDSSGTKKTDYSYEYEDLLEAYIGEDYKVIKKLPINIWAFLLNWMYLLYRKLYITGIVGLIISWIVVAFLKDYFLIYLGIIIIVLGFAFNKYYIFISKKKVERIVEKSEEDDKFVLANICREKGGVNVPIALLIYFAFLIAIFFTFVTITINTSHNTKFWQENSNNRAGCMMIIKTAYKNVESENKVGMVTDAVCKIIKKEKKKEYEIYIKSEKDDKKYYSLYITENGYVKFKNNTIRLDDLQIRRTNGSLSEEEQKSYTEIKSIELNYQDIYNKAQEEDELIKKKKNKEEKSNFSFTQEEIIQ